VCVCVCAGVLNESRSLRHTKVVECIASEQIGSLPSTPALVLDGFDIFTAGIMRIENQVAYIASSLAPLDTKHGIRQDTTT
jgi:hypothetical protein